MTTLEILPLIQEQLILQKNNDTFIEKILELKGNIHIIEWILKWYHDD